MTEKWELVTSFPKLRTGDYVKVHCDHPGCGDVHRGILSNPVTGIRGRGPDGKLIEGVRYDILGGSHCTSERLSPGVVARGLSISVSARTVARRIVYRLDVGLEQEQTVKTSKPRKLVTQRP